MATMVIAPTRPRDDPGIGGFGLSFYGAVGWICDLHAWATGISTMLEPGGRFVYVEFHPLWGSSTMTGACATTTSGTGSR